MTTTEPTTCSNCGNEIDTHPTKVIFRWWKMQIIALFPEIPSDVQTWYNCLSYMHIGQHSGANSTGIIQRSRPATEAEYAGLKRELEGCPYHYTLDVRRRENSAMRTMRQLTHMRQQALDRLAATEEAARALREEQS